MTIRDSEGGEQSVGELCDFNFARECIGSISSMMLPPFNLQQGDLIRATISLDAFIPGNEDATRFSSPLMSAGTLVMTVPQAVSDLIATEIDGVLNLAWTATFNDGGSEVTNYVLEYDEGSGATTWGLLSNAFDPR